MFTSWVVLHEITNKKRKQTFENAQYELEIVFNIQCNKLGLIICAFS